jgi:hypothetical protein
MFRVARAIDRWKRGMDLRGGRGGHRRQAYFCGALGHPARRTNLPVPAEAAKRDPCEVALL